MSFLYVWVTIMLSSIPQSSISFVLEFSQVISTLIYLRRFVRSLFPYLLNKKPLGNKSLEAKSNLNYNYSQNIQKQN